MTSTDDYLSYYVREYAKALASMERTVRMFPQAKNRIRITQERIDGFATHLRGHGLEVLHRAGEPVLWRRKGEQEWKELDRS